MLATKNIATEGPGWESLNFLDLLRAFNSKDHYQIRLAIFDIGFLSECDQKELVSSVDFRRSAKHSLLYLNEVGDVSSIKQLIKIMEISPEELKEPALVYTAKKGVLILSAYGYFSNAFQLLEIYNIPEEILSRSEYQKTAYLGLAAMKNSRVNEQTEIKKISQKYQLPKITETEWEIYNKEYFLLELSDPLIYKGYSPARHNLSDWQDFLSAVDPNGDLLEGAEINKAATAGVKKVYAAGQRERAGQLILYFSLWTVPELAEIVAELKQFILNNVFSFSSAEGAELNCLKKIAENKTMILPIPKIKHRKLRKEL